MQRQDRNLSALSLVRLLVHTTIDQSYTIKSYNDLKNLFIAIDFSKEKIDVAIISSERLRETAAREFNDFKTTVSGYKQLLRWLQHNSYGIYSSLWLFCGENTGDYSKALCNFLYGKGYDIWLENAKNINDASRLRRLKSYRAYASMIAEYAMRNNDRAIMYEPLNDSLVQLRQLFLYRHMVIRHRCSFQVRRGEKKLTMEKSPLKTMISQIGRHIVSQLNKKVEKIDKRITQLFKSNEQLTEVFTIVTSVPGIATHNAVCLMVYTDNFLRFNYDSRKIACHYGIAPFGNDSGSSVHADPRVHYMANRQIKAMLTQAALPAVNFNPIMARYYMRLVERGKKKQVALNNVKNKLVHLVTAMVKNRQLYTPDYKFSA